MKCSALVHKLGKSLENCWMTKPMDTKYNYLKYHKLIWQGLCSEIRRDKNSNYGTNS